MSRILTGSRTLWPMARFQSSFAAGKRGDFFQTKPEITNQFLEDPFLIEQLELEIPEPFLNEIRQDLTQFGHKCATNIYQLHLELNDPQNAPKLINYDAWGNRVDKLIVSSQWQQMKSIGASEGLISIAYERKHGIYSRLYQVLKLYLFAPSSGLFSCPLAMTDGAAKTLESVASTDDQLIGEVYTRLVSRDPLQAWTSGQWMTERRGGSDVANGTETVAVEQADSTYKLYGYKWFSSATDADVTVTLARCHNLGQDKASKGLSMFLAKVRNGDGRLNGIEIHKLKDKLGTRQMPTAELLLDGCVAWKMSEDGRGIAEMSNMLNITRLHNAVASVSNMRRVINLARDYAIKRNAFGKKLTEYNLHNATICDMEVISSRSIHEFFQIFFSRICGIKKVECRASFLTLVHISGLLGKSECGEATSDELELLRILTPLLKLYTAKQAIAQTSEGLEAFGGQGYIEDTGLPALLRDSQVLSIWEGTTNILSLDVLRSIQKSKGNSLQNLVKRIRLVCEKARENDLLKEIANRVLLEIISVVDLVSTKPDILDVGARHFAFSLYRLFTASLIMDRCLKTNLKETDIFLLKKWCVQDLSPILTYQEKGIYDTEAIKLNLDFFMDGHPLQINN